eukprot:TRINITY_DN23508_c0_g1_i1.p1 TRINITY_DN23508_c0_g1~~TRINITY_DN23508_c0_g1_i1.p1  ORF type:complete len:372 (+),score=84.21 TRINITY_DN23508_c0_g1_i1:60-1118(+)
MDVDVVLETQDGQPSGHGSLIHDLQLSSTGKRLVSCSTDRRIVIWDLEDVKGKQKFIQSGVIENAHSASVTKLSWAHHSYGQIIASCGLDNKIKIQQEVPRDKSWKTLFDGVVGTGGVTDVKFAPRQFGLKIATASHDGGVKTLLASGSDFDQWQQVGQFEPTKKISSGGGQRIGVTCLDWNPSTLEEREMLVMGTDTGAVVIWASEGQGIRDKWFPMTLHKEGSINTEAIEHGGAVTDVAWAPSIGRGYQLIASSSKDGSLFIHKLYPIGEYAKGHVEFNVVPVFEGLGVHNHNNIWRISWNLTGTTLASSGDDGYIMTWQQSLTDTNEKTKELTWRRVQCLQPKNASDMI